MDISEPSSIRIALSFDSHANPEEVATSLFLDPRLASILEQLKNRSEELKGIIEENEEVRSQFIQDPLSVVLEYFPDLDIGAYADIEDVDLSSISNLFHISLLDTINPLTIDTKTASLSALQELLEFVISSPTNLRAFKENPVSTLYYANKRRKIAVVPNAVKALRQIVSP